MELWIHSGILIMRTKNKTHLSIYDGKSRVKYHYYLPYCTQNPWYQFNYCVIDKFVNPTVDTGAALMWPDHRTPSLVVMTTKVVFVVVKASRTSNERTKTGLTILPYENTTYHIYVDLCQSCSIGLAVGLPDFWVLHHTWQLLTSTNHDDAIYRWGLLDLYLVTTNNQTPTLKSTYPSYWTILFSLICCGSIFWALIRTWYRPPDHDPSWSPTPTATHVNLPSTYHWDYSIYRYSTIKSHYDMFISAIVG